MVSDIARFGAGQASTEVYFLPMWKETVAINGLDRRTPGVGVAPDEGIRRFTNNNDINQNNLRQRRFPRRPNAGGFRVGFSPMGQPQTMLHALRVNLSVQYFGVQCGGERRAYVYNLPKTNETSPYSTN